MESDALYLWPLEGEALTEVLLQEIVNLRSRLASLGRVLESKDTEIAELRSENTDLKKTIQTIRAARFTSNAERLANLVNAGMQMSMDFDEGTLGVPAPQPDDENDDELVSVSPKRPRRKRHPDIRKFLDSLRTDIEIFDDTPAPDCPICGEQMHILGYEKHAELRVIPAQVKKVVHFSPVFSCRNCEQNNTVVPIVRPEMQLARPLERCVASAETLAFLVYAKIFMAMPLYRMERAFNEIGVPLNRMTMSNWMIGVSENWLEPLCVQFAIELLKQNAIHADETTAQVLLEDGRTPQSKGFVWMYCSIERAEERFVVLVYNPSRAAAVPRAMLCGFTGILIVDGYAAYEALAAEISGIVLAGCWAHCRRKWYAAVQITQGKGPAVVGFEYVEKLFVFEQEFAQMTSEDRLAARIKFVKPLLKDFHGWLKAQYISKSAFGAAVEYTLNHWDALCTFLSDGRIPATNARAELVARDFAIGRKNFMFSKTLRGCRALMASYSVVETARANDLNVYEYLTWIFREMPKKWGQMYKLLEPAWQKIDALAKSAADELRPIIMAELEGNALFKDKPGPVKMAAVEAVRDQIISPVTRELRELITAEGKRICAMEFMPRHAPPQCRKMPAELPAEDKPTPKEARSGLS